MLSVVIGTPVEHFLFPVYCKVCTFETASLVLKQIPPLLASEMEKTMSGILSHKILMTLLGEDFLLKFHICFLSKSKLLRCWVCWVILGWQHQL